VSAAANLLDRLGRPGDIRLGLPPRGGQPLLATGIVSLDAALGGGLPRGRVVELTGRRSTGRTGLACAIAAHATRQGTVVGWVDPADALDPDTMVATGIAPTRVLWIRPRSEHDAPRATELVLTTGGFGLVVLDLAEAAPHPLPWPRLARAAERTRTTLLVLSHQTCTGSHAALGLEVGIRQAQWDHRRCLPTLFDGIAVALTVTRHRYGTPGRTLTMRHACA
jgi:hypothetical protein